MRNSPVIPDSTTLTACTFPRFVPSLGVVEVPREMLGFDGGANAAAAGPANAPGALATAEGKKNGDMIGVASGVPGAEEGAVIGAGGNARLKGEREVAVTIAGDPTAEAGADGGAEGGRGMLAGAKSKLDFAGVAAGVANENADVAGTGGGTTERGELALGAAEVKPKKLDFGAAPNPPSDGLTGATDVADVLGAVTGAMLMVGDGAGVAAGADEVPNENDEATGAANGDEVAEANGDFARAANGEADEDGANAEALPNAEVVGGAAATGLKLNPAGTTDGDMIEGVIV